ncbi:MAG: DUF86 domain-containing protein, partial [Acidobacteria bacterium]|nr:DUF86 domain-containing protein [Acidobacteriota bacterium]
MGDTHDEHFSGAGAAPGQDLIQRFRSVVRVASAGGRCRQGPRLGIIEPDLAERLRAVAGLRDVLVHAYLEVGPARIWEHIEDAGGGG